MTSLRPSCRVAEAGMTQTTILQVPGLATESIPQLQGSTHRDLFLIVREVSTFQDMKISSRQTWRELAVRGNEHCEMGRRSQTSYDDLSRRWHDMRRQRKKAGFLVRYEHLGMCVVDGSVWAMVPELTTMRCRRQEGEDGRCVAQQKCWHSISIWKRSITHERRSCWG